MTVGDDTAVIIVVVVDQFQGCFAGVSRCVMMVCVQTGLFLRSSLPTAAREHVLVIVEVKVLILVKVSLHFLVNCWQATSKVRCFVLGTRTLTESE